eukprot:gene16003-21715_t
MQLIDSCNSFYESLANDILHLYQKKESENKISSFQLMVGIAGCPGVGKSTISKYLNGHIPCSIIVPMDGFHFSKAQLSSFPDSEIAFARRGAHFTFDGEKFVNCLNQLKQNKIGSFPSFDHSIGDPIENDIIVTADHKIIIIEGNYLLLDESPWNSIKNILDFIYFIDCPLEISNERVYNRHLSVGCDENEARKRVNENDGLNSILIQSNKQLASKILLSP